MLQERPSDSFHWKNKLDELSHIPGDESLDKACSWEKLHTRLGDKPKKRFVGWYWLAAAALVMAIGLQWLRTDLPDDQAHPPHQGSVSKKQMDTSSIVRTDVDFTTEKKTSTPGNQIRGSKKLVNSNDNKKTTVVPVPVESIMRDSTSQQAPVVIAHTPVPEDTVVVAVITPVRKKLRVIHINDLDSPVPGQHEYARKTSSVPVSSKLSKHDALSAFTLGGNASDNIVKIKLSPSN